jgi:hypothetical protein
MHQRAGEILKSGSEELAYREAKGLRFQGMDMPIGIAGWAGEGFGGNDFVRIPPIFFRAGVPTDMGLAFDIVSGE